MKKKKKATTVLEGDNGIDDDNRNDNNVCTNDDDDDHSNRNNDDNIVITTLDSPARQLAFVPITTVIKQATHLANNIGPHVSNPSYAMLSLCRQSRITDDYKTGDSPARKLWSLGNQQEPHTITLTIKKAAVVC